MRLRLRFRGVLVTLVLAVSLVTALGAGTVLVLIRGQAVATETASETERQAQALARRTETLLAGVEQIIPPLLEASRQTTSEGFTKILDAAVGTQPLVRALYFLDAKGQSFAVGIANRAKFPAQDLIGIDFSLNPLFLALKSSPGPVWSDKFVSTLAANTSIGVGVRSGDRTAIAELALNSLQLVVDQVAEPGSRVMVVDNRGELVVDTTDTLRAGIVNLRNLPFVHQSLEGHPWTGTVRLDGVLFHVASTRSQALGWSFFVAAPSGFDDPKVRSVLVDVGLLILTLVLLTLAVSPLWSSLLTGEVASLRTLADQLTMGNDPPGREDGPIQEFRELSEYLRQMGTRIREREQALVQANRTLEDRVRDRTIDLERTNAELRHTLDQNRRIQASLVEAEKLAALGRLVAGVAHEMNTPIGNAQMALSSLDEALQNLNREIGEGLRRSTLDFFTTTSAEALELAGQSLHRAAGLVTSFKQIATGSGVAILRQFDLASFVEEVILAIQGESKTDHHRWELDFGPGLLMESYPAAIGQVLNQLISNALVHAWPSGQYGTIKIGTQSIPPPEDGGPDPWIRISVSDDGRGIPLEDRKRIFEPFFTTKVGEGRMGLGLNIAYNTARVPLGGNLTLGEFPGPGATFFLDLPTKAP